MLASSLYGNLYSDLYNSATDYGTDMCVLAFKFSLTVGWITFLNKYVRNAYINVGCMMAGELDVYALF